ncbi:MAG: RNA polymerase sigma factor [Lachnospiraceae bacterium]|nr:RNA polymerase sigma factor [Lachnospiraceae bacterium]MBD5497111.1 RNA polymerase sigma factor [Lachnospiraceae bacterium]MBD5510907.1 RNA polymerase sigma factor [Lachnospiraceae bacterium]
MESLDEIYQKYSQKVYLFLLGKTGNENLAEELTQETFFQAVQSIRRFRGQSSVLTWLCGIAQNLWLKYLRDNKKQEAIETVEDVVYARAAESELMVQWDNVEILRRIHELAEPMREVMYLRLVGNLSFAQVGEILGKNENWARVNFYRGKKKIMEEMKRDE